MIPYRPERPLERGRQIYLYLPGGQDVWLQSVYVEDDTLRYFIITTAGTFRRANYYLERKKAITDIGKRVNLLIQFKQMELERLQIRLRELKKMEE